MKKIDLGQTISILANFGVVAGIVFLGIELRQTTASVEGATYQALSDGSSNQYIGVVHNSDFAETIVRVYEGDAVADFSVAENSQLIFYYNALIQRLENSYFQLQTGLVDDRILRSYGWGDGILETQHFSQYWTFMGATRISSPEFRQFFEQQINLWSQEQSE